VDPADLAKSEITIQVQTASVDTGIEKRDNHLREDDFFGCDKFPKATFTSTAIKITKPGMLQIRGKLTLRGKTKTLTIPAKYEWAEKEGGRQLKIKGSIQVIRQEFDINYVAGMLLPDIDKEVDIIFDVLVKPQQTQ